MNKLTKTAPERIYLQVSDDHDHYNTEFVDAEVTWCRDSVMACEVEYVRADVASRKKVSE
jgi:hypothetical protein